MKDSPLKRLSTTPLEEVITERDFAQLLQIQAQMFFRFGNTLLNKPKVEWGRQDFFQLITEADSVEALLDDHGARYNRTFCFLRELVASLRGIALTGFSLAHLERRIESYGATLSPRDSDAAVASLKTCKTFVMDAIGDLFLALHKEAFARGLHITSDTFPEGRYHPDVPRRKLPRNMGQQELESDEQKIAEVASKFLQACGMFEEISVHRIENEHQREAFLQRLCTEERARVYEATVHNLQSTYDTYVKNTVLEAKDENLPKLRGHISAALHLLEAVTHLAHFVERHERAAEKESVDRRIAALVRRSDVRDITLNHLLYWAVQFMTSGRALAEKLLASYTNVLVLQVEVEEDVTLHARPAALIVGIVNRYGTPVEMEIDGHTCNAASILDLLVTVGSHPQARRYTFRGDENPLRDIQLLFENGLGEAGFDRLPPPLSYLRTLGS